MAKLSLEEELHKVKAARSVDDLQRYENSFIFRCFLVRFGDFFILANGKIKFRRRIA